MKKKSYYQMNKEKYMIYRDNERAKKLREEIAVLKKLQEQIKKTFIGTDNYEEGTVL